MLVDVVAAGTVIAGEWLKGLDRSRFPGDETPRTLAPRGKIAISLTPDDN